MPKIMTNGAGGMLFGLVALAAIASCEVTDEGLRLATYSPGAFLPDAENGTSVDAGAETEPPDAGETADGSQADDSGQADATEPPEDTGTDDAADAEPPPPEAASAAGLRRHVIILVGDGMQLAHEIATSRYLTGFDDGLVFHAFPVRVFKTTWDVGVYNSHAAALGVPSYSRTSFDPTVGYDPALGGEAPYPLWPDMSEEQRAYLIGGAVPWSSSTATAMATGFKTDLDNLAWLPGDPPDGALETSPERLRRLYGMSIGYVTTHIFPHATPGGWFAHSTDRFAYSAISHEILTQTKPDVVIGGGAGYADPADLDALKSSGEYLSVEQASGVDGSMSLLAAAVMANQEHRKLLGLFANSSFAYPIPSDSPGAPAFTRPSVETPTMAAASIAALEVLSRNPNGFFLLLEQEDIDLSNHANNFAAMVGCVYDLDRAVEAVIDFIDRPDDAVDWTNTTVIVTADHANSYLRLERPLDRGDLPTQEGTSYPDGEISYGSGNHTNELTTVYARGLAAAHLMSYTNVYPGLNILDDTSIYHATLEAARR